MAEGDGEGFLLGYIPYEHNDCIQNVVGDGALDVPRPDVGIRPYGIFHTLVVGDGALDVPAHPWGELSAELTERGQRRD